MANVSAFTGAFPVIPGGRVLVGAVEQTSTQTYTNTTLSGASDVFPSNLTFVADGSSTYEVEFYCGSGVVTTGEFHELWLTAGGATGIGLIAQLYAPGTGFRAPMIGRYRYKPSAGTVTLNCRGRSLYGGQCILYSTNNTVAPISLVVHRVVNQNDGLKPFWTPPVVTQLPSNATVGDQVVYAADATNGVYWSLYYDGIGTYPWKFVGGPPLLNLVSANGESTTSSSYAALTTAGPTLTLPLAGDYDVNISAVTASTAAAHYAGISSYDVGATGANDAWAANFGVNYGPGYGSNANRTYRHTGLAASTLLVGKYRAPQSVQVYFNERVLTATPVRVAA